MPAERTRDAVNEEKIEMRRGKVHVGSSGANYTEEGKLSEPNENGTGEVNRSEVAA